MSGYRLALGRPGGLGVSLRVVSRAYPGGLYVFDDNWLFTLVRVEHGAGSLRFEAFLRCHDFARLEGGLSALRAGQRDHAAFEPRDPWLVLHLQRTGSTVAVDVDAHDNGSERVARCAFEIDDAELGAFATGLREINASFPVLP